jgi:hypothetical protein
MREVAKLTVFLGCLSKRTMFSLYHVSLLRVVWERQIGTDRILQLHTWADNKVRELIAVKLLHTSLLNITVVAFRILPLGSYAPMPAPSAPFKTILELLLWNGLQSCRRIISDVINVIKMPSFQLFPLSSATEKVIAG